MLPAQRDLYLTFSIDVLALGYDDSTRLSILSVRTICRLSRGRPRCARGACPAHRLADAADGGTLPLVMPGVGRAGAADHDSIATCFPLPDSGWTQGNREQNQVGSSAKQSLLQH